MQETIKEKPTQAKKVLTLASTDEHQRAPENKEMAFDVFIRAHGDKLNEFMIRSEYDPESNSVTLYRGANSISFNLCISHKGALEQILWLAKN